MKDSADRTAIEKAARLIDEEVLGPQHAGLNMGALDALEAIRNALQRRR